jgi:hypothetical protein
VSQLCHCNKPFSVHACTSNRQHCFWLQLTAQCRAIASQHPSVGISFIIDKGPAVHELAATFVSNIADFGPQAGLFPPGQSAMDFSYLTVASISFGGVLFFAGSTSTQYVFRVLLPLQVSNGDRSCSAVLPAPRNGHSQARPL